jgi:hypothetical protein
MKARRTVDKKFQERIRNEVAEEFQRQSNDMTRRHFKLFCVALHQAFGFGKDRFSRVMQKIEEIGAGREHDEVSWSHIDNYCKYIGFDFPDEDYEKMDL